MGIRIGHLDCWGNVGVLRSAPHVVVGLLLGAVLAAPSLAAAYDWEIYLRCERGGANMNVDDLTAASVGIDLADADHEDWAGVEGYAESAMVQMNQDGTGAQTRQRGPIRIVKPRSKSSPEYMRALVEGAALECTLEFWDTVADTKAKVYTIIFDSARVSLISSQGVGNDVKESIEFYAASIEWRHELAGTQYKDNVVP